MSGNVFEFGDMVVNATERVDPKTCDGLTYVGLEHLQPDTFKLLSVGTSEDVEGQKFVMKKGDVLFGRRRAYQRKVGIAPSDGIFSAHGMILRPREDVIIKEFLPFFIRSDAFMKEAIRQSEGSLSPTLNWSSISDIQFSIPSLDEQPLLADILWKLENLNDLYRQRLELYDELIKSRFIHMFGSYEPITKMKDACSLLSRGKPAVYVDSSQYFIIGQACIRLDCIEFDRVRCLNPLKFNPDYELRYGDVLVNSTGVGSLGRCNYFYNPDGRQYVTDSHVTILRLNLDDFLPCFVKYYINQPNVQSELYSKCVSGSTNQIELIKTDFEKFLIPKPPIPLQREFESFVEQVNKSKVIVRDRIDKTAALQRSILNNKIRCADYY